jgi:hypothetical protein
MLAPYHLPSRHTNGLDRKFPTTHVEQIFQTWSKKVNNENVVQSFLPKVVYLRNALCGEKCER